MFAGGDKNMLLPYRDVAQPPHGFLTGAICGCLGAFAIKI